ncbi:MAG: DUF1178 family protein [Sphingomonadales bacterium]
MIVFDLNCRSGHRFEIWFRSSDDYGQQRHGHEIECPICGDTFVDKAVMAPNVGVKGNQRVETSRPQKNMPIPSNSSMMEEVSSVSLPELPKKLQNELASVLAKVQKHVENNCDYVGDDFAEEARKIHYGETQKRGIYGEATEDESEELVEEGIDIVPIPLVRKSGPTDA